MPLRGAADESDFTVRAGDKPGDLMEAIVPIFRVDDAGRLHMVATGFFISRLGIFASAKHAFLDVIGSDDKQRAGLHVMQFSKNKTYYLRPVQGFVVHEEADVGVGVCFSMHHKFTGSPLYNLVLTLSRHSPRVGDTVWTYGYPGTTVAGLDEQHVNVAPGFFVGAVQHEYTQGRDRLMLPHPCYETSMVLHGGSSGGPVFAEGHQVVGINSSGMVGEPDVSFVSRIVDVFPLGIPDVQLPGETSPRRVTIEELATLGYVSIT